MTTPYRDFKQKYEESKNRKKEEGRRDKESREEN